MRFFDLKSVAGFLSAYGISTISVSCYDKPLFPNFNYLVQYHQSSAHIIVAIPIDPDSAEKIILDRITAIHNNWDKRIKYKPAILTPTHLQAALASMLQAPIKIQEHHHYIRHNTSHPTLPICLGQADHLGGIIHLTNWSIGIDIGPITFNTYINLMHSQSLNFQVSNYLKINLGKLWSYRITITIIRRTCPLPILGNITLDLDGWL